MNVAYTAILHGVDEPGDIGVSFPDFPGCVSSGRDIDEAFKNAREALEFHLEGMAEEKLDIPEKSDRSLLLKRLKECKESAYPVLVYAELPETGAERINITVGTRVLRKIDRWAEAHKMKRSALLVKAAEEYIQHHEYA